MVLTEAHLGEMYVMAIPDTEWRVDSVDEEQDQVIGHDEPRESHPRAHHRDLVIHGDLCPPAPTPLFHHEIVDDALAQKLLLLMLQGDLDDGQGLAEDLRECGKYDEDGEDGKYGKCSSACRSV